MEKNTKILTEQLLDLQEKYCFVKRVLVTNERYEQIALTGLVGETDYSNEILREPLIEHVGHLPILASFLHPYVEHTKEIDLGRVLIMLSIHDIGETELGDVFTYDKTAKQDKQEQQVALQLLSGHQKDLYLEYEARESLEAKFAKAIDALAPIIHSMYRPQLKIDNFKRRGAKIQDIVDHKAKYFDWDWRLKEIFDICIEHFIRVERNEPPIFLVK